VGQNFQNVTLVDLGDCDDPAAYLDSITRLPCLETLVVGGERFGDEHLRRLKRIASLRALLLDSSGVTESAVADHATVYAWVHDHARER
jgi:hypothetical protein